MGHEGESQGEAPAPAAEHRDPDWEELVIAYARQLPARVDALADSLIAARADGTTAALTEPRRLAHRLYGTAGSYGLEAFSAVAGRIEDALVAAVADGPLDGDGWRRIERELRALREHAESAGRGTPGAERESSNHAG